MDSGRGSKTTPSGKWPITQKNLKLAMQDVLKGRTQLSTCTLDTILKVTVFAHHKTRDSCSF